MNDMPLCWGELMPGDLLRWKVSTSQGPYLMLLVVNRHDGDMSSCYRHNSVVEFFDMESGKVRRHECDDAAFLLDMNATVTKRAHAKDA